MPTDEPFDWNKPPRDKHGNVITVADPQYQEKLLDAFQDRLERDLRNSGLKEELEDWSRRRHSSDINVAISTVHTPQQKAAIVLESLDPRFVADAAPEIHAAIKELQKVQDTPMGKKPEPISYEIYQSLRELAGDTKPETPQAHGYFSQPIKDFAVLLVKNDLISTTPHRTRG